MYSIYNINSKECNVLSVQTALDSIPSFSHYLYELEWVSESLCLCFFIYIVSIQ